MEYEYLSMRKKSKQFLKLKDYSDQKTQNGNMIFSEITV